MIENFHNETFTVGIGGAAGDGIREAGNNLSAILRELGYDAYFSFTYPSLIRGGHNYSRLTFSKKKVWCDHTILDALIALDEPTIKLHRHELAQNAVVFADSFDAEDVALLKDNAVVIPMAASSREISAAPITRNSTALGALCYLLDLPLPLMLDVLHKVFREKSLEANIVLANKGYDLLQARQFRHAKKIEPSESKKILLDGNTAFAKGLQAAGLDFYFAYPMTPASSILHYLAREQKPDGLKVIQPENEIAVISMALGASYAGKRVAIGTATGGFALMGEAYSFASIAEFPLAIAVSMRQGPATGVPTYSSQTDLRFVLHAGHGEFPRIVIAPGDPKEAFHAGIDAMNLAWKYQMPVIILLDKIVSENSMTSTIDTAPVRQEWGPDATTGKNYVRYAFTENGVSPLAFPGTPDTTVHVTSYEHDEAGITADEAEPVKKMLDKRNKKNETIVREMSQHAPISIYGDPNAETAIVFFGSVKSPLLEAVQFLDTPLSLVQIKWLAPFPTHEVAAALSGKKRIIGIEANHEAQLAGLLREKTGIVTTDRIERYDSRPFEPETLALQIKELLSK